MRGAIARDVPRASPRTLLAQAPLAVSSCAQFDRAVVTDATRGPSGAAPIAV